MNNVIYRKPIKNDAKNIVDFYNFVGGETNFLSFEKDEYPLNVEEQLQNIKDMNDSENCIMLLAIIDNEIVGIGTIHSASKIKLKHVGELGIVVAKKYHGLGIGSELMKQLIDWCKLNGITKKIELVTRTDNDLAVKLYQKLGFEIEGISKNSTLINGEFYDLYYMGMMI